MKIVVFEHLRKAHAALVRLYLRLGYSVRFIEIDNDFPLPAEPVPDFHSNPTRGSAIAFDMVERGFSPAQPLIETIVRLYGSEKVLAAFKKSLTIDLEKAWVYTVLHRHMKRTYPQAEIRFVPKSASTFARSRGVSSSQEFSLPRLTWLSAILVRCAAVQNKLFSLAVCVHYLLSCLARIFRSGKREPKRRFRFGICVVSPAREFANTIRGVGFLLDDEHITAQNTLFVPIVPITDAQKQTLARRGFQFADIWSLPDPQVLQKLTAAALRLALGVWSSPDYIGTTAGFLIREYGFWSAFAERYAIDNLISYSDFAPPHIGRNVYLGSRGVRTWYYIDGANTWDVHLNDDDTQPYRDYHWGYLAYDNLVSWSSRISRFFQRHPQNIGQYFDVGCIWSEHVRLISEGRIPSRIGDELLAHGYRPGLKIVAVFDSTYANDSLTPYSDGAAFAEGLLRLLRDLPDIYLVIKEKKARSAAGPGAALSKIYSALESQPRCFFAGHKLSASEVVACADLTISFPFTTTAIEALGAKRKAIFFDAVKKYAGTYYDSVPGLVAHGYEELMERVHDLLFDTTDQEYERYLATYIKGDIEPFLDGYGLTRFRELLTGAAVDDRRQFAVSTPAVADHE